MAKRLMALLLPAALVLSACGETMGERAASGGGIGAATGVIAGLLLPGVSWWGGALIGAAGGAVVGAATTETKR
ncbi:MAG: bacteriocin [Reyranellaceae bacterium]